jgi:hypothetical protein
MQKRCVNRVVNKSNVYKLSVSMGLLRTQGPRNWNLFRTVPITLHALFNIRDIVSLLESLDEVLKASPRPMQKLIVG